MAPLPDNLTDRYFIDYQQGAFQHTMMIRAHPDVLSTEVDAVMTNVFTLMAALVCATTVVGVRLSRAGQNHSFPIPSGLVGDSFGTGTPSGLTTAQFLSWVGRTESGRRSRIFMFGYDSPMPVDFRLTSADVAAVGTIATTFTDAQNIFLAADGTKPTFYSYANIGVNAYWQRNNRE